MRFTILLAAVVCFAQQAPERSAITGRVVSASTGAPLKKALVWMETFTPARGVTGSPTVPPVTTDAEGRFTLNGVEPGSYLLLAKRIGYLDQGYGAAAPEVVGPPVELAPGETKTEIIFKLTPQSLLYGKVSDDDGDPVPNAQITVLRVSYAGGRRHLIDAGSADTQDDGSYVVGNLQPGRYFVSAALRLGDQPAPEREKLVPTYYPATPDPSLAAPVEVTAGAEVRGLAIRMRRARVFRVRGRLVSADAEGRLARQRVVARRLGENSGAPEIGVDTTADGRFTFDALLPGAYTLVTGIDTAASLMGAATVTVSDAEIDDFVLRIGRGAEVIAMVKGPAAQLSLKPAGNGKPETVRVDPGAAFAMGPLLPDRYDLEVAGLPEGSYVKSVRFGGQRVDNGVVDLTAGAGGELIVEVSPDAGEVAGKVDQPGAVVQIWPSGGDTARSLKADARGEFRFASLPPGDYRVLAWQDLDDDLAQYAPFRARFESDAVLVHVGEKGHERVEPKRISHEAIAAEAAKLK